MKSIVTPMGPLYLVASEKGLSGVFWRKPELPENTPTAKAATFLDQAEAELMEYLAGKRRKFSVALDVSGTEFQKRVWHQLRQIPFGQTVSYREIAQRLGQPKAVRAVGTANGRNPVSVIVPCHRVIAADGTLGGYSGGLSRKTRLLGIEGVRVKSSP
jgi:methylated-DNA-[protein]-cysteine S-methyltransferase